MLELANGFCQNFQLQVIMCINVFIKLTFSDVISDMYK